MAPPSPPKLMLDVIDQILLRIPPEDPAHLLRASLVCKAWRSLLTDPAFLRLYRAFHRKAPMLGFFCTTSSFGSPPTTHFIPASTFRPRYPERRNCHVIDCRHGRVLLFDYSRDTAGLLVWDPITGEGHHIPRYFGILPWSYNAAVLCAAADCDHLTCHGGPFVVVLTGSYRLPPTADYEEQKQSCAWVYSSEAGKWSTPIDVVDLMDPDLDQINSDLDLVEHSIPPVLAGGKIYFVCRSGMALYDLQERGLSLIDRPSATTFYNGVALIPVEDGGLEFAGLQDCELGMWSLEMVAPDRVAKWTQSCVIKLDLLLTITDSMRPPRLMCFVDAPGGGVLFLRMGDSFFRFELESHKISKVDDIDFGDGDITIIPFMTFVTPECGVGRLSLPDLDAQLIV